MTFNIDDIMKHSQLWRDISSAPKDGTKIALSNVHQGLSIDGLWYRGAWRRPKDWVQNMLKNYNDDALVVIDFTPTHWAPLPELQPKMEVYAR